MKKTDKDYTLGSNNVFADLGFENAEELHLKAKLSNLIARIIKQREWTQKKAAEVLGIKQPDVSELTQGKKLEHYSVERLMKFLSKLDQNVTITVSSDELATEIFTITDNESTQYVH